MRYTKYIHAFLFSLVLLIYFNSCSDEDINQPEAVAPDNTEAPDFDGYSINIMVTLDHMGGRSVANAQELEAIENYIDIEKFRVLFFDHQGDFLFESKSRWVKKLEGGSSNEEWLVSVPVFTYGNDYYNDNTNKEYNWGNIRKALTSNKFKVAILANRPEEDFYPGYDIDKGGIAGNFYDNRGPFWGPDNSVATENFNAKDLMNVFDLHHSQYDPIYKSKSLDNAYYDFIMEYEGNWDYESTEFKPKMGSTACWINTDEDKAFTFPGTDTKRRTSILPSYDYPIPMYGIQEFEKIEGWMDGTPFNISPGIPKEGYNKDGYVGKSISLLRSVVKVELWIPITDTRNKSDMPKFVALSYPNVNSRCEPMDVWTPTDKIWKSNHPNGEETDVKCDEFERILKFGPISKNGYSNDKGGPKTELQQQLAWFYGSWLKTDKTGEWTFSQDLQNIINRKKTDVGDPPQIFNPCTQRNNLVILDYPDYTNIPSNTAGYIAPKEADFQGNLTDAYSDGFYHYVAYVGERNINDPSDLGRLGGEGAGQATIMFWYFEYDGRLYTLPLTDYNANNNTAASVLRSIEYSVPIGVDVNASNYCNVDGVANNVRGASGGSDQLTWPLIRNHVYRLKLGDQNAFSRSSGSSLPFSIKCEDFHTEDINFHR